MTQADIRSRVGERHGLQAAFRSHIVTRGVTRAARARMDGTALLVSRPPQRRDVLDACY